MLQDSNLTKRLSLIRENLNVISVVLSNQVSIIERLLTGEIKEGDFAQIDRNETIIDGLELKIRSEVLNTIVLFAPKASESRLMFAYHDLSSYLERIGDLLCNVAEHSRELDPAAPVALHYLPVLQEQLHRVNTMTQDAIVSFFMEDSNLAKQVIRQDEAVDAVYYSVLKNIPNRILSGGEPTAAHVRTGLLLNSISYNLERIGDNATNIAEAAIFHTDGKDVRHPNARPAEPLESL